MHIKALTQYDYVLIKRGNLDTETYTHTHTHTHTHTQGDLIINKKAETEVINVQNGQ